jgi:toxin ParE1/3/4
VSQILLEPCVERELWNIWLFIAEDNPEAASRVIDAAFNTFRLLSRAPLIGKDLHFRHPNLRNVRSFPVSGFTNYLVFYRPVSDGIQVLHVFHGARDLEALLDETEN